MKIYYEEGPERVVMGEAGMFVRGEAREVADDFVRQVMAKGTIRFKTVETPRRGVSTKTNNEGGTD